MIKEPVDMIWIKSLLLFKKEGKFREVLTGPDIDFCTFGRDNQNGFLLQQASDLVKKIFPGFKCPCSVVHVSNITVPSHPVLSILPTGFYKLITFLRQKMQEMMFSNSSCKLTKVDRKINAINIYILLKEPVDMIWMKCILYFKKEGNFREVLTGPEIDFCTFGKEKQNGFLLQQIQDLIQRVFPGFKCPRSELNISNITIPAHPIMSVLPTGFYKLMTFIRYTENGPSSYNVTTLFQFETYKDRL
ncbi:unnamed protein product [Chironomus riparius]|uniref:Uncharacterized protein n=1 Tax=Chironomus riparius TaxID=315576 RepID=A0A9N9WUW8_9DIPT|nr:unnamed protein product [Chironomus riparius]